MEQNKSPGEIRVRPPGEIRIRIKFAVENPSLGSASSATVTGGNVIGCSVGGGVV